MVTSPLALRLPKLFFRHWTAQQRPPHHRSGDGDERWEALLTGFKILGRSRRRSTWNGRRRETRITVRSRGVGAISQVTLMSIPIGGDIGLEAHPETDQFLRLDGGSGRVQMGSAQDELSFDKEVSDGWCVLVPAGTWHKITNTGATPMQVYTIYAPAHHAPDKVQATAAGAGAEENDEPAAWSVQPGRSLDEHG